MTAFIEKLARAAFNFDVGAMADDVRGLTPAWDEVEDQNVYIGIVRAVLQAAREIDAEMIAAAQDAEFAAHHPGKRKTDFAWRGTNAALVAKMFQAMLDAALSESEAG